MKKRLDLEARCMAIVVGMGAFATLAGGRHNDTRIP